MTHIWYISDLGLNMGRSAMVLLATGTRLSCQTCGRLLLQIGPQWGRSIAPDLPACLQHARLTCMPGK